MKLESVLAPVQSELDALVLAINNLIESIQSESVREAFQLFFAKKGKFLRPALLFLANKATHPNHITDPFVIPLAQSLELTHSASLIHDDIIDKDDYRRGQETLNKRLGTHKAVLMGDIFFSHAYAIISSHYDNKYAQILATLTLEMCQAEIIQAGHCESYDTYIQIIQGKTARFMSVCCQFGAMVNNAEPEQVEAMRLFGLYFGMAFQIKDDMDDQDVNGLQWSSLADAHAYMTKAMGQLDILSDSDAHSSLTDLCAYVMGDVSQ